MSVEIKEYVGHKPVDVKEQSEKKTKKQVKDNQKQEKKSK